MSFLGKVIVFAARELAQPTLTKIGEHIGDAVGNVIGKKIDPTHGDKPTESEEEDADEAEAPKED